MKSRMNDAMHNRIKQRLESLGMSASAASRKAGLSADFIRDMMRKGSRPGAENLAKLARTLKTSPEYLLEGNEPARTLDVVGMPVIGVIEAGQFRDITLTNQDEEYPMVNVVQDDRFPHARQYALRVSGDSMNEMFPDGSYAICAEFADTGMRLKDGLVLHVERYIAGTHLVETTLKQVESSNGRRFLAPRSTNPRHKPVEITEDTDLSELKVRGLVIGSYTPQLFGF